MQVLKIVGLLLSLSLAFNPILQAQEQLIDRVIAIVGDEIVLTSDIEMQFEQAKAQGMEDGNDNLKCQLLEQMLLEKMFQTHAMIDSIEVAEEEVQVELDRRVNYFLAMFGGNQEELEAYYGKSILQIKEEFRDPIRSQLLAQRMQASILSDVKVTPAEVKAFYNSIPQDSIPYLNAEIEVSQLVILPQVTKEQKEAAKNQLLTIKQRIVEGEEFAKMAGQFSQDPGSAANGGDLGWTERGQFVPEFEGAAFKLRPGEMSEPIESSFGYHLIQLIERRGDKIHTRHILLKPEVGFSELKQAEKRIDSIRNVILNDTLTFKEAVEKYSDDEETKNIGGTIYNQANGTTSFEMSELDPTVFFITDGLQEGDISEAIEFEMRDGTKAYRIIYVKSRTKPHLANLNDDYYKLQKIVEAQKQNETLVTWIQKNAPNTYIKIHDDYYSCEAVEKWVKK